MDSKFTQCVFVEKEDTFLECDSLEELLSEFGEEYIERIVGYFPPETNVTYGELQEIKGETNWTVAYHEDAKDGMVLVHFASTLELKRKLDSIIAKSRDKDYVNIYKSEDIVYI